MPKLLSKREVFDRVKEHLLTQNEKSLDPLGRVCVYHGGLGLKCAIGCLIPEELYTKNLEGRSLHCWNEDTNLHHVLTKIVVPEAIPLLRMLQSIHDNTKVVGWSADLKRLEDMEFPKR